MVAEVRRRFGVPVVVRYTSTESSLGTGTTLTSSDEEVATTVGRPVPGVELAIVDDEGTAVAAGSVGRVLLRSPAVIRGYWGRGPGRGRRVEELVDAAATATVLGTGRVADHRRLRAADARGQPAAVGAGPRALHPGGLQRVPGRGRGGPLVPSLGRPRRGGRGARRRARRGGRRRGRGRRRRPGPNWPRCVPTAPGSSPTTRPLTHWSSSTSCP